MASRREVNRQGSYSYETQRRRMYILEYGAVPFLPRSHRHVNCDRMTGGDKQYRIVVQCRLAGVGMIANRYGNWANVKGTSSILCYGGEKVTHRYLQLR